MVSDNQSNAEATFDLVRAELKRLDPANPMLGIAKAVLEGSPVRLPSLLARRRMMIERLGNSAMRLPWSASENTDQAADNICGERPLAARQTRDPVAQNLRPGSARTDLRPPESLQVFRQAALPVPSRQPAILQFLSSVRFFRGRFAPATIAEGGTVATTGLNNRDRAPQGGVQ